MIFVVNETPKIGKKRELEQYDFVIWLLSKNLLRGCQITIN